jgi:hypothetical protein
MIARIVAAPGTIMLPAAATKCRIGAVFIEKTIAMLSRAP